MIQNFGEIIERPAFKSDIKKTEFLDLNSTATIRILTKTRISIYTHYINRATVICLGDDCPICRGNKNLVMQYPDTFKEEAHYTPRREIFLVNVLDKTPSRVCQNCGAESRSTIGAVACGKCNTIISGDSKPLMKVKVLSKGITLRNALDSINNAVLDDKGEIIGIINYDITLAVSGTGKDKVITPIPGQVSPISDVPEEELFDLEKVTIELDASEMLELQRGVSLRDIFAARRASEKSKANETLFLSENTLASVQSDVEELFKG